MSDGIQTRPTIVIASVLLFVLSLFTKKGFTSADSGRLHHQEDAQKREIEMLQR